MEGYEDFLGIQPIVIDNGSGFLKAGMGGEEAPTVNIPNIIGRPKHKKVQPSSIESNEYIGPAENIRGLLKISYPIEHGVIENWDDMRSIWRHVYTELKAVSKEHAVLLTQPVNNPRSHTSQLVETFFESFDVPALFIAQQPVLSQFAFGRTTGLVVESGDGVTQCVPIYEGYAIQNAISRIDLGGKDIISHYQLQLRRKGYNFTTSSEFEIIRTMKECTCEVADKREDLEQLLKQEVEYSVKDSKKNKSTSRDVAYYLPDGTQIGLGQERHLAPEIMFDPSRVGLEVPSVQDMINNCLKKTDLDLRKTLYDEILLTGGNTMIRGFPERLQNELMQLSPKDFKVKYRFFAPPERAKACWVGGSSISKLGSFKSLWVTKNEYKDHGDRIFDMKQF